LQREQRHDVTEIPAQDERPQLTGHGVQLVEREEAADEAEREEPPATEVDERDNGRQEDGDDEDAREEGAHRRFDRR
jgi:hypothetical protein